MAIFRLIPYELQKLFSGRFMRIFLALLLVANAFLPIHMQRISKRMPSIIPPFLQQPIGHRILAAEKKR